MAYTPKDFNEELKKIGGLNPFGDPRLILVHGSEARFHSAGPLKYIKDRKAHKDLVANTFGLLEYKFSFEDIPLERFVIEEWIHPKHLSDHNQHRYVKDELGNTVDLLGPFPARGKYRALMILEDKHGNPIPLGQQVLDLLKEAKYKTYENLDRAKRSETDAPTQQEIDEQLEEFALHKAKQEIALQSQVFDMVDDAFNPHLHRLTLANHREGLDKDTRRGSTYDPNWDKRLKEEKHASTGS